MTSKAAPPWVRSVGSGPGGGDAKGTARERLQPQHTDLTDLTNCHRVGIQYSSRTAAMVTDTPP